MKPYIHKHMLQLATSIFRPRTYELREQWRPIVLISCPLIQHQFKVHRMAICNKSLLNISSRYFHLLTTMLCIIQDSTCLFSAAAPNVLLLWGRFTSAPSEVLYQIIMSCKMSCYQSPQYFFLLIISLERCGVCRLDKLAFHLSCYRLWIFVSHTCKLVVILGGYLIFSSSGIHENWMFHLGHQVSGTR